jgi:tRNA (guanine37-N1)-methyltransferase
MKISILTLFPQMFSGPFDFSIINRAREKGLVQIEFIDIRNFGVGPHKTVDDKPYGGGQGMILKIDVLKKAIDSTIDKKLSKDEQRTILLAATGKTYNQNIAKGYSKLKHLIVICGHYEGVDARVTNYIDEEVSIGDYVLTGGEIPAMAIADSVTRLVPGVLKDGVTQNESFSDENILEYPQYTRPENFEGISVPKILLGGNHAKIEEWKQNSKKSKSKR